MSTYTTPIEAMLETQRSAIKQSQRATSQAIAFQNSANRMALSSVKSSESTQRQGVELLEAGTHSYLSAVEAMTPVQAGTDQFRQNTDELFSQLKSAHADLFETLTAEAERGVSTYEDLAEEFLDALDKQTATLLDAHEDLQSQLVEGVEDYEAQTEEVQGRFEEAMDEQMERAEQFQERLEAQFETQVEQAERFQQQLEDQAQEFQDQLDEQAAQFGAEA